MMEKFLIIIVFFALLAITVYAANLEYTTTLIYFNIAQTRIVEVQTLGGSWVNTTSGGAPTTGNIEFNTSTGTETFWVNASIVGGSPQTDANPILQIRNQGSIDAEINISINATTPSCIRVKYENDTIAYPPTTPDLANSTSALNLTLIDDLAFGETPLDLWLFANFTGCGPSDTTERNLTIWADYAS